MIDSINSLSSFNNLLSHLNRVSSGLRPLYSAFNAINTPQAIRSCLTENMLKAKFSQFSSEVSSKVAKATQKRIESVSSRLFNFKDSSIVRDQIGQYVDYCDNAIDSLVSEAVKTKVSSESLLTALKEIRTNFFHNPENFQFTTQVKLNLEDSKLYEDLNELLNVLKGISEELPLPERFKTDEEKDILKSAIRAGAKLKVISTIKALKSNRDALAKEAASLEEQKAKERDAFEKAAAIVKAKHPEPSVDKSLQPPAFGDLSPVTRDPPPLIRNRHPPESPTSTNTRPSLNHARRDLLGALSSNTPPRPFTPRVSPIDDLPSLENFFN